VIQRIVDAGLQAGQVATVNIPALNAGEQAKGVRVVRQCTRPWVDTYERRQDPKGRDYYWNSSVFRLGETESDTDVAALRDGYVTITPLQFDLTDHGLLKAWGRESWRV
jgi:5'-nucleotidase